MTLTILALVASTLGASPSSSTLQILHIDAQPRFVIHGPTATDILSVLDLEVGKCTADGAISNNGGSASFALDSLDEIRSAGNAYGDGDKWIVWFGGQPAETLLHALSASGDTPKRQFANGHVACHPAGGAAARGSEGASCTIGN